MKIAYIFLIASRHFSYTHLQLQKYEFQKFPQSTLELKENFEVTKFINTLHYFSIDINQELYSN